VVEALHISNEKRDAKQFGNYQNAKSSKVQIEALIWTNKGYNIGEMMGTISNG
jgi:hypothetical protein